MIEYINIHINTFCPFDCYYCFIEQNKRKEKKKFSRWNDLRAFLNKLDLADSPIINLATGELSLFPELVIEAVKEIRKLERIKDVKFRFGLYTNGSKMSNIIKLIDEGYLDEKLVFLSWDSVFDFDGLHTNTTNMCINEISMSGRDILVRSALTEVLLDTIDSCLSLLINNNIKRWEYYMLIDEPKYNTSEFKEKFKKFLDTLYKYKDKIEIWNIKSMHDYYSNPQNHLWCTNIHKSIMISINGKILPCGSYTDYYRYTNDIDIELKDILDNTFDYEKDITNMMMRNCKLQNECHECKNNHCVECAKSINFRTGNTAQEKAFQQCDLRTIERKYYEKYLPVLK